VPGAAEAVAAIAAPGIRSATINAQRVPATTAAATADLVLGFGKSLRLRKVTAYLEALSGNSRAAGPGPFPVIALTQNLTLALFISAGRRHSLELS